MDDLKEKYVYGIHTVSSLIESDPNIINKIYFKKKFVSNKNLKNIETAALQNSLLIEEADADKLSLMAGSSKHQGVVCLLSSVNTSSFDLKSFLQITDNPFILMLDSIKDPGNLGACIRTANAVGCQLIIKRKSNSCPINSAVHKASSGGSSNIHIFETNNLSKIVKTLKQYNVEIIGTDHRSKYSYTSLECIQSHGVCVIMGSEDKGISSALKSQCNQLVSIPIYGSVECLNISVACAVMLYEVVKYR